MTWTCHVCQHVSRTYAAAERHARIEGHGRIECNTEARKR